MIVTADEYEACGISFLKDLPVRPLDWKNKPNRITLVDTMPLIGRAFENSLSVSNNSAETKNEVRLAVEGEVSALYQENGESEEEQGSKLNARAGLYLIREMAFKLK